jgi:hypothetical protein
VIVVYSRLFLMYNFVFVVLFLSNLLFKARYVFSVSLRCSFFSYSLMSDCLFRHMV